MSLTEAGSTETLPLDEALERWELRIGVPVYATDRALGELRRVVVHPGELRVDGLIVHADLVPPRDLAVPLAAVVRATDDEVRLKWSSEEAKERGACDERTFHIPARTLLRFAHGEAVTCLHGGERGEERESGSSPRGLPPVLVGLRVDALDGRAGRVREVLVNSETGRMTHLVARHGLLWKHDLLVPGEWVRSVTAEVVTLEATLADLERLPVYRPDEELEEAILEAWWEDDAIRAMSEQVFLQAKVRDGVALLEGYAWCDLYQQRLEELTVAVPGVLAVRNEVISDEELRRQVMGALRQDPRTAPATARVHSYVGNISITGQAPDEAARAAITEVAAAVPGVRSVVNEVEVLGMRPSPPPPESPVTPRVGQRVVTRDGLCGYVYRVIVSPRTGLVSGIVVSSETPATARARSSQPGCSPHASWPPGEQRVVISRRWIRAVTNQGVVLNVASNEAAASTMFDPQDYGGPGPAWTPPEPFQARELLIDRYRPDRPLSEYLTETRAQLPSEAPSQAPSGAAGWGVIVRGDRVRCAFGPVGTVDHLLVDPDTHHAVFLVVLGGEGLPHDTLIPVEWIEDLDEDGILLDATYDQLRELPPYEAPESDAAIGATVRRILEQVCQRPAGASQVQVQVERGVVRLTGSVETAVERRNIIAAARETPGVREVRHALVVQSAALPRLEAAASSDVPEGGP